MGKPDLDRRFGDVSVGEIMDSFGLFEGAWKIVSEITCAALTSGALAPADVPTFMSSTFDALGSTSRAADEPEKPQPAVSVKKSVTDDAIFSLITGKPFKSLKRHIAGHGYTPETYRKAFDLPSDYPMVAANYAKQRSELAKTMGLGRKRDVPATAATSGRKRAA